jgi:hypothetical protein
LFRVKQSKTARGKRKEENEPVAKNFLAAPPAGGNALKKSCPAGGVQVFHTIPAVMLINS